MDKIAKFLLRLTKAERKLLLSIMADVRNGKMTDYDIRPLKGYKKLYRLRKGGFRVIFWRDSKNVAIVHADYRKDAYKKL